MTTRKESIAINGAGPVGSLLAIMLAEKGYKVDVFESRPDSRKSNIYQGKSINLALSDRGWLALEAVGIADKIKENAIPMYRRVMHDVQGNLTQQAYGQENQAIWSVSRAGINEELVSLAEQQPLIDIHFEHRLSQLDFDTNSAVYTHQGKQKKQFESNIVFGADGTFSKVRRLAQELPKQRISYSLDYMPQSYIELHIPAGENGEHLMDKNALHIWPRKNFMLIALPNPDGSFTCTLFMDYEGDVSFAALDNEQAVTQFFYENFADAMPLLEDPIAAFMSRDPAPLCLVHIYPWIINENVALIGDAAHAMVPFYGQGLNCGFEDCRVLSELVEEYQHQWPQILSAYQQERKPNGDAIIELAQRNFVEMSDLAGDASFLLRKQIEAECHKRFPHLWVPLYSMVTFSPHTSYQEALRVGDIHKRIMDDIMAREDIVETWQNDEVYQTIEQQAIALIGGAR